MGSGKSKIKKTQTQTKMDSENLKMQKNEETKISEDKIRLPLLESVEIDLRERIYRDSYKLTQSDVEYILSHCGMNLNKLIIGKYICDSSIMLFVKKYCHNLEIFEIDFRHINEDYFIDAFENMTKLKSLTVNLTLPFPINEKKPVNVTKILKSVHDDIEELFLITDQVRSFGTHKYYPTIPTTFGRFQNLRQLIIQMYNIDNNAVTEISKIKSLIKLEFLFCKIMEGTSFILNLPNLKSLELIYPGELENLENLVFDINGCEKLEHLDIVYTKMTFGAVIVKLSNLKNLKTSKICEFDDENYHSQIMSEHKEIFDNL